MKISQKKLPSVIYRKSNWLSAGSLWLSWLLWRRDWIYSNKCVSSILFYFGAVVNFKEWWIDIGTMNIRQSSETVVVILKDSHASFLFEITLKMPCEKASLTEHLTACSKCGILYGKSFRMVFTHQSEFSETNWRVRKYHMHTKIIFLFNEIY